MPRAAGPFLDLTDQLLFFAFGEVQVIVRQPRKPLFQFASGDVPISYEFQDAHAIGVSLASKIKISFATAVPLMLKKAFIRNSGEF